MGIRKEISGLAAGSILDRSHLTFEVLERPSFILTSIVSDSQITIDCSNVQTGYCWSCNI